MSTSLWWSSGILLWQALEFDSIARCFPLRALYEVPTTRRRPPPRPASNFIKSTSDGFSRENRAKARKRVLHCHNESFACATGSSFRSQNFSYLFAQRKQLELLPLAAILKSISTGMTGTLSLDVSPSFPPSVCRSRASRRREKAQGDETTSLSWGIF